MAMQKNANNKDANPSYKLDVLDRKVVAALYYMGLWTPTHIANAYGVTRKTVYNCKDSFNDLSEMYGLPAHPMYGKLMLVPAQEES